MGTVYPLRLVAKYLGCILVNAPSIEVHGVISEDPDFTFHTRFERFREFLTDISTWFGPIALVIRNS